MSRFLQPRQKLFQLTLLHIRLYLLVLSASSGSLFLNSAQAATLHESSAVKKIFNDADVNGTFVLYDVTQNRMIVNGKSRANKRFTPGSTFKIPNTLIGLSVGSVKDVDEVLPYGGKPQPFKAWERDMGLREAIKVSNVPVYQELARRTGLQRMDIYVNKLDYGNANIGTTVDNFWLVGPLKISAVEQASFLADLAKGALPLSAHVQQQVREIVLLERGDGWTLYGKTGWVTSQKPDIGWWVGWVVKSDKIYSFALNIDVLSEVDLAKRIDIGKSSLKALGVLP